MRREGEGVARGNFPEEVMPLQPQGRGERRKETGAKHSTEEKAPSRTQMVEAAERL